jgi:hypothetical protein
LEKRTAFREDPFETEEVEGTVQEALKSAKDKVVEAARELTGKEEN